MKNIVAVICEYNPFHNGHMYHLNEHRRELSASGIVCIMSGSFTQRGTPAILNKWLRAEMAVRCGADLVLELPVCFCSQSAERFARGAVSLAESLGIVDYLSFGSECGDSKKLKKAADFLLESTKSSIFKEYYKQGISYPAARQRAFSELADTELAEIIKTPNNILGIEYITALKKIKSNIIPVTIKRYGAEHGSVETVNGFSSASKIREMIKKGESIKDLVPKEAYKIIEREIENIVCDFSPLSTILTYILRTKDSNELKYILDMSEGLENRFLEAAKKFSTMEEICSYVKTKRYTQTRIERIACNILLGITADMEFQKCEYIRVLALNAKGADMLNLIKEKSQLPIITKTADARLIGNADKMLALDLLSTDIYAMLTKDKYSGQDFTRSPIFVGKD